MSSFPTHENNIKQLVSLGFDVSEALDSDGEVTFDSWGYDEQVYLYYSIIAQILALPNELKLDIKKELSK